METKGKTEEKRVDQRLISLMGDISAKSTAENNIGRIFSWLRKRSDLKQAEFAKKVKKTMTHVSLIEKGNRVPSDRLVKEVARLFSRSKEEQQYIERYLLLQLASYYAPPSVKGIIRSCTVFGGQMLPTFLARLRSDIGGSSGRAAKAASALGMEKQITLEKILAGKGLLTSGQVSQVAQALNQDEDEYLVLAGYIPHFCDLILSFPDGREFLRKISSLLLSVDGETYDNDALQMIQSAVESVAPAIKQLKSLRKTTKKS